MPRVHPMCTAMATASHRFLTPFPTEFAKAVAAIHHLKPKAAPSAAVGASEPGAGDTEAKRIIATAVERDEFFTDVDGFAYYWPNKGGHLSAWQMRVIAAELDRRNKPWQEQIEKDLGTTPEPSPPAESPALPQFPEGAESNTVLWGQAAAWTTIYEWCRENGMPSYSELNGLENLAQWILDLKAAAKPHNPNAAPADKPRMRQVTLRECRYLPRTLWAELRFPGLEETGRTAVVEVPESEDTPPRGNDVPATDTVPFKIAPIYDKNTDSLMIYLKDTPSFARRQDDHITLFLDRDTESIVGVEVTRVKQLFYKSDKTVADISLRDWCQKSSGTRFPDPSPPAESPASQSSCSPVCDLCGNVATCFGQYADHDKGFACDSCCGHGNEDGWCMTIGEYDRQNSTPSVHSPSLPSPWRPMTEVPNCDWFWLAWNDGQVILSRDRSHWNLRSAVSWMPAVPPLHPNDTPADKPRMRQVTLREYEEIGTKSVWSTSVSDYTFTGRTAVVEVPE